MGAEVDEVMAATSRLAEAQSMRQATSLQALPFVHWALLYIIAVGARGFAFSLTSGAGGACRQQQDRAAPQRAGGSAGGGRAGAAPPHCDGRVSRLLVCTAFGSAAGSAAAPLGDHIVVTISRCPPCRTRSC